MNDPVEEDGMSKGEQPSTAFGIAPVAGEDAADWLAMRTALWPGSAAKHGTEIEALLAEPGETITYLARSADGTAQGFAEASLRRDYVNGCKTSPVAFLEGIFVQPEARGKGVARLLVGAVEGWAQEQGCSEFASDAPIENLVSADMHRALGFAETQRVVFFKKVLG